MDANLIAALKSKFPEQSELGRRLSDLGGPAATQVMYEQYIVVGMDAFLAAFEKETNRASQQPSGNSQPGSLHLSNEEQMDLKTLLRKKENKGMSQANDSDAAQALELLDLQEWNGDNLEPLPEALGAEEEEKLQFDYSQYKIEPRGNAAITLHHKNMLSHHGMKDTLDIFDTHTNKKFYSLPTRSKNLKGGPDDVIAKKGMINPLPASVLGIVDNKQNPEDKQKYEQAHPSADEGSSAAKKPPKFSYNSHRRQCILLLVAGTIAAKRSVPLLLTDGHIGTVMARRRGFPKDKLVLWRDKTMSQAYWKFAQELNNLDDSIPRRDTLPSIPENDTPERLEIPEGLANLLDVCEESERFSVALQWLKPFSDQMSDDSDASSQSGFRVQDTGR